MSLKRACLCKDCEFTYTTDAIVHTDMDLGSGPCNNSYHCAAKIKHDCVNKLADSNTTKARSATHFATNRIIRAAWDAIIIRVQLRMCQFFFISKKNCLENSWVTTQFAI